MASSGGKKREGDPLVAIGSDTTALPVKWVCLVILLECMLSLSINFYNSWLLRFLPGFVRAAVFKPGTHRARPADA